MALVCEITTEWTQTIVEECPLTNETYLELCLHCHVLQKPNIKCKDKHAILALNAVEEALDLGLVFLSQYLGTFPSLS